MRVRRLIGSLAIVALFVAGAFAPAFAAGDEQENGVFRVEAKTVELGPVAAGSDAVGTFIFHNDSDKDVKILRAKPG